MGLKTIAIAFTCIGLTIGSVFGALAIYEAFNDNNDNYLVDCDDEEHSSLLKLMSSFARIASEWSMHLSNDRILKSEINELQHFDFSTVGLHDLGLRRKDMFSVVKIWAIPGCRGIARHWLRQDPHPSQVVNLEPAVQIGEIDGWALVWTPHLLRLLPVDQQIVNPLPFITNWYCGIDAVSSHQLACYPRPLGGRRINTTIIVKAGELPPLALQYNLLLQVRAARDWLWQVDVTRNCRYQKEHRFEQWCSHCIQKVDPEQYFLMPRRGVTIPREFYPYMCSIIHQFDEGGDEIDVMENGVLYSDCLGGSDTTWVQSAKLNGMEQTCALRLRAKDAITRVNFAFDTYYPMYANTEDLRAIPFSIVSRHPTDIFLPKFTELCSSPWEFGDKVVKMWHRGGSYLPSPKDMVWYHVDVDDSVPANWFVETDYNNIIRGDGWKSFSRPLRGTWIGQRWNGPLAEGRTLGGDTWKRETQYINGIEVPYIPGEAERLVALAEETKRREEREVAARAREEMDLQAALRKQAQDEEDERLAEEEEEERAYFAARARWEEIIKTHSPEFLAALDEDGIYGLYPDAPEWVSERLMEIKLDHEYEAEKLAVAVKEAEALIAEQALGAPIRVLQCMVDNAPAPYDDFNLWKEYFGDRAYEGNFTVDEAEKFFASFNLTLFIKWNTDEIKADCESTQLLLSENGRCVRYVATGLGPIQAHYEQGALLWHDGPYSHADNDYVERPIFSIDPITPEPHVQEGCDQCQNFIWKNTEDVDVPLGSPDPVPIPFVKREDKVKPVILIGKWGVGKTTLFNHLTKQNKSVGKGEGSTTVSPNIATMLGREVFDSIGFWDEDLSTDFSVKPLYDYVQSLNDDDEIFVTYVIEDLEIDFDDFKDQAALITKWFSDIKTGARNISLIVNCVMQDCKKFDSKYDQFARASSSLVTTHTLKGKPKGMTVPVRNLLIRSPEHEGMPWESSEMRADFINYWEDEENDLSSSEQLSEAITKALLPSSEQDVVSPPVDAPVVPKPPTPFAGGLNRSSNNTTNPWNFPTGQGNY